MTANHHRSIQALQTRPKDISNIRIRPPIKPIRLAEIAAMPFTPESVFAVTGMWPDEQNLIPERKDVSPSTDECKCSDARRVGQATTAHPAAPDRLASLDTPVALVDASRMQRNIQRMQQRMDTLGVRLRPHIKTSKCLPVIKAQIAAGASGDTVSTLKKKLSIVSLKA